MPRSSMTPPSRVHPRAGGAAMLRCPVGASKTGPSPLRRGSHGMVSASPDFRGAIPAQAGQPQNRLHTTTLKRVHPRAGGAAGSRHSSSSNHVGQSPRWRSRPLMHRKETRHGGSIPALAGPSPHDSLRSMRQWVHPRAGGAALFMLPHYSSCLGPSPRWRGSHGMVSVSSALRGAIPAQAGQSYRIRIPIVNAKVHPRAGGAAALFGVIGAYSSGSSPRKRGRHHALIKVA